MDEVARANLATYSADGSGTGASDGLVYMAAPYHARRIARGVELLVAETRRRTERPLVADLGAGSDHVSTLLRRHGARAVMVDIGFAGSERRDRSVAAVGADLARPLPFRTASLDGVFAGEIVEHLFDPLSFLRECERVLVPHGAIVVTTPNLATLQDRVRFLYGRSPRQVNAGHPYLWLHIRPFTYSSLARLLTECALVPVALRSGSVVVGSERRSVSSTTLARVFPSLGGSLIVAGVKGGRVASARPARVGRRPRRG